MTATTIRQPIEQRKQIAVGVVFDIVNDVFVGVVVTNIAVVVIVVVVVVVVVVNNFEMIDARSTQCVNALREWLCVVVVLHRTFR